MTDIFTETTLNDIRTEFENQAKIEINNRPTITSGDSIYNNDLSNYVGNVDETISAKESEKALENKIINLVSGKVESQIIRMTPAEIGSSDDAKLNYLLSTEFPIKGVYSQNTISIPLAYNPRYEIDENDVQHEINLLSSIIGSSYVITASGSPEYLGTVDLNDDEAIPALSLDRKSFKFDELYLVSSNQLQLHSRTGDISEMIQSTSATYDDFIIWTEGILSNVRKDGNNSYKIPNVIKFNDEGKAYINSENETINEKDVLYNGFVVTKDALSTNVESIGFDYIISSGIFQADLASENTESLSITNVKLCYDAECKMPIVVASDDEKKRLICYNTISGNPVLMMNLDTGEESYLSAYQFIETNVPIKENFIDWYNVDTRINYNKLNNVIFTNGSLYNYSLNVKNATGMVSTDSLEFNDMNLVISDAMTDSTHIVLSSNSLTGSFEYSIDAVNNHDYIKFENIKPYDFASLFSTDSSELSSRRETMLSFNFKIPEDGWSKFNDEMYAENKHYLALANYDLKECLPSTVIRTVSSRKGYAMFNGVFLARMHVFKSDFNVDDNNINNQGWAHYDTGIYQTNWTAKITKAVQSAVEENDNVEHLRLNFSSGNDSFAFSMLLDSRGENNKGKVWTGETTIKGLYFPINVNGIVHNVQIPKLNISCKYQNKNLTFSFKYGEEALSGDTEFDNSANSAASALYFINYDIMKAPSQKQTSGFFDGNDPDKVYELSQNTLKSLTDEFNNILSKYPSGINGNNAFGSPISISSILSSDYDDLCRINNEISGLAGSTYYPNLSCTIITADLTDDSRVPPENKFNNLNEFEKRMTAGDPYEASQPWANTTYPFTEFTLFGENTSGVVIKANHDKNPSQNHIFNMGSTEIAGYFKIYLKDAANFRSTFIGGTVDPETKPFGRVAGTKLLKAENTLVLSGTEELSSAYGKIKRGKAIWDRLSGVFGSEGTSGIQIGDNIYHLAEINSNLQGDTITGPYKFRKYTKTWCHCYNAALRHDVIIFMLSGQKTPPQRIGLSSDFNSLTLQKPVKWPYMNILPILEEDPKDHYFLNWTSINDLVFTTLDSPIYNDLISGDTDHSIISGIVSSAVYENSPIGSDLDCISSNTSLTSICYDMERFVKPFDMSTNLLYYKGTPEGSSSDNVFIINARKMHTNIDYMDEKPKDSSIQLDESSLYEKEITLTGIIDMRGGGDTVFTEIYPYVKYKKDPNTSKYDYSYTFSDKIEDPALLYDNYKRIRYTDYRSKGQQWRLYKTVNSMKFTTTDDFTATFMPDISHIEPTADLSGRDSAVLDKNDRFEIPCKMTLEFDGLIFQQKVREGVDFDDVSTIDYPSKIYSCEMFDGSSLSSNALGYKVDYLSSSLDNWCKQTVIESDEDIIRDGDIDNPSYVLSASPIGYEINPSSYQDIRSIGDSEYNLDYMNMNILTNSVSRWKTTYSKQKYSDLFVYSDYNPAKSFDGKRFGYPECIGTPYTNLDDKILLTISGNTGTSTDGAGTYFEHDYIAGRFKIATDDMNVNNIRNYDDVDFTKYEITNQATVDEVKIVSGSIENNVITIQYSIRGTIADTSTYGYKMFDMPVSGYLSTGATTGLKITTTEGGTMDKCCIFFDSLLNDKEIYLAELNKEYDLVSGTASIIGYKIAKLNENATNVKLSGDGNFGGTFELQMTTSEATENKQIEIHNVKLPEPIIKQIKIGYNDNSKLTRDGFLKIDDDVWSKHVYLNNAFMKYESGDKPIFTFDDASKIKSNCIELYDDNGNIKGLFVTLKIKGFKKLKESQFEWYFENPETVVLSTPDLVSSYQSITGIFENDIMPSCSVDKLNGIFPEYNINASLGDVVLSSESIKNRFNPIITAPLTGKISHVGECIYKVNPPENDKFQIEIIASSNGTDYKKEIFFVNKPIDRWYNLSLYKYTDMELNNENSISSIVNYGFSLTDVTADSLEDVTENSDEIFNCFISNDSMIEGETISTDTTGVIFSGLLSSGMYRYTGLYNIKFDPCSRHSYTLNGTTDPDALAYSDLEITETEYERKDRKNHDLFKISDRMEKYLEGFKYTPSAEIHLFDNNGVSIISKDFVSYKLTDAKNISLSTKYNEYVASALINYAPRRIFVDDSDDYYMLREKDKRYHISPVPGMSVKSLMWIVSPDFYEGADAKYVDNETDSRLKLKEFKKIFDNPQNKLPPVYYSQKILNSDYATLVYNACNKLDGVTTTLSIAENIDSKYAYNYSKNPSIIAYVWDNSQVSRNETFDKSGNRNANKLYYSRLISDFEYIAEVGSIYNYEDRQNETNIVVVESSPSADRQVVLYPDPLISNPLDFEKISNETGYVKVKDKIIATAALGFNSTGYSRNGVMVFEPQNSTGKDIKIDLTQTTYLYLAQNDQTTNCSFGVTQEKPVYVDTVLINTESLPEGYDLITNLPIDVDVPEEKDPLLPQYYVFSNSNNVTTFTYNSPEIKYVYDYDRKSYKKFDAFAMTFTLDGMDNSNDINNKSVFIDEKEFYIEQANHAQNQKKKMQTLPSFDYDGVLKKDAQVPIIEIDWHSNGEMPSSYSEFKNNVNMNVESNNVFLSDKYGSLNVAYIDFSIKKEFIENAPILIEFEFLTAKYNENSEFTLVWVYDEFYDFNIIDTYKDEFDLVKNEKSFRKVFSSKADGTNLAKNCFGIRMKIKQIMPQINESNYAVINDIKVKVSNIINKYGNSSYVNDVYVRKIDANCRNHYNMDVAEYVWRLPVSKSEWKAVFDELSGNQNVDKQDDLLIDNDFFGIITGPSGTFYNSVLENSIGNTAVSAQLDSGKDFSFMNTFYITNDVEGRSIKQLLSDSYMIESNMKVTWKYVDYVYISYSCYGKNSRTLLSRYFGDKIYSAVKAKLINNINNMNANSAFKDRFEFSGGIMVSKEEQLNENQHTDIFKWNTSQQLETNWTEVYTETTSNYKVVEPQPLYEVNETKYRVMTNTEKKWRGNKLISNVSTSCKKAISQNTYIKDVISKKETRTNIDKRARINSEKDHYGATIENAKYSNVEKWTNSIEPIMIKFKIN